MRAALAPAVASLQCTDAARMPQRFLVHAFTTTARQHPTTQRHAVQALYEALQALGVPGTWDHILHQIGMFSFTGLTKPQVENLIKKWHIYLTSDGRISMAGLNEQKCKYLAEAMADSVATC